MSIRKTMLAMAAFVLSTSAMAQVIASEHSVSVHEATCTKTERESLVGAGAGAVAGGVAGNLIGGLFGSTGSKLGAFAGGLGGAMLGNEVGKNTIFHCDAIVLAEGKKVMVQYTGNDELRAGQQKKLYKMENGQMVLK